jgi:hypothetical protein
MSRRDLIRRLERLETRMGTDQPRVKFRIRLVEPGGRIASTLVLETGREPRRSCVTCSPWRLGLMHFLRRLETCP